MLSGAQGDSLFGQQCDKITVMYTGDIECQNGRILNTKTAEAFNLRKLFLSQCRQMLCMFLRRLHIHGF